ncbi:MAG TPA: c-type cytochrome [Bacteroidia bacterium]|nr:c-type cytochrome [Bacteroidia bacterium]
MKKTTILICLLTAGLFSCGGGNENKRITSDTSSQSTEIPSFTEIPEEISVLLTRHTCATCHKADEKLIGPPYKEIAQRAYKNEEIVQLMYSPKPENWPGYPPMLPQKQVPQEDAMKIAGWINSLK